MDSLITAAARALATGDTLGGLKPVGVLEPDHLKTMRGKR